MNFNKDIQVIRAQVWAEAWVSVAGSDNCSRVNVCTKYADECLKRFDERFSFKVNSSVDAEKD